MNSGNIEICICNKCDWQGSIAEADQRTKDELLYLFCPNGCEVMVAPPRPLNASEDYFVNIFLRMLEENTLEKDKDENFS